MDCGVDIDTIETNLWKDQDFVMKLLARPNKHRTVAYKLWARMRAEWKCDKCSAYKALRYQIIHLQELPKHAQRKDVVLTALSKTWLDWRHLLREQKQDIDYL